jgi:Tol biopolymer transport system component
VNRWIFDLDWSGPTNTLIFVTNDEEGRYTIWSVKPDGSRQTALIVDHNEIVSARWSPRGDAVYYTRRSGKTVSLYRIATDGRTPQPPVVVMTGLETDGAFSLSGDGSSLVYARAPYHSNLWVVDLADSDGASQPNARPLTHGTAIIERPRVSPDGQDVLFNVGPEGDSNLFTVPIAGGTPSQLTFLTGYNLGGAWSPNGAWVAFVSTQDGRPRVWRVSATGGRPEALSTGDVSDTYDVNWSPGPNILYQQSGNRNYYALDPSTGRERLLVSNPSVGWLFSPVYSPRTARIAVSWSRNVGAGVWVLKPDGEADSLVVKGSVPGLLGWSTDEAWLYAAEGKRATYRGAGVPSGETMTGVRIFKVSLAGARQVVLSLPFDEVGGLALSPDAQYLVCTVYSATSDVWRVDDFDSARRDLADATPRRTR